MSRHNNKRLFIIPLLKEVIEMKVKLLVVTAIFFLPFCREPVERQVSTVNSLINTSHLDALYEEINVEGKSMGIIHIYSDFPDYNWLGDDDEGIACIDDAARAVIFYLEYYKASADQSSIQKAKRLLEFLFYMQSDNGFFYNFIFEDYSINKDHKNSFAEPNWWSWRAMWALSEGYSVFKDIDNPFAELIFSYLSKAVNATKQTISNEDRFDSANGISFPTWLPGGSAGDQASVLILALLNYLQDEKDTVVENYVNKLCDGILCMQKGDSATIPYYAFLSWQNIWHAYGNSQSYSILKASKFLDRKDLVVAALNEINYFYDYLIQEKHLSSFSLGIENDHYKIIAEEKFSQIAYNLRPMIYSCLEAFRMTNDSIYAIKAGEIALWFLGKNIANEQVYFPQNGICYDGINSENDINKNSGAESTIEALLSLQQIENISITRNKLLKIISKN